jgi:hypothetical protein
MNQQNIKGKRLFIVEKYVKWVLLAVTVIGLAVCIPIYCFQLEPIRIHVDDPSQNPVEVTKFNIHVGSDMYGNTTYSIDVTFIPTATTKPDQDYHIVIDNGFVFPVGYDIQWYQLELNNNEPKPLTAIVSSDQYLAMLQQPQYNLLIYEWRLKHDLWLILPWIIPLVLFLSLIIFRVIKPPREFSKLTERQKTRK